MQMYEISNASESKNVQISHRLRILLLTGIFLPVSGTFLSSEHIQQCGRGFVC